MKIYLFVFKNKIKTKIKLDKNIFKKLKDLSNFDLTSSTHFSFDSFIVLVIK